LDLSFGTFDECLCRYKYIEIISSFTEFSIHHISRRENVKADSLAQASDSDICEQFQIVKRSYLEVFDVYSLDKPDCLVAGNRMERSGR
jgi:hypothetical protein